jgi:hypothetical protein
MIHEWDHCKNLSPQITALEQFAVRNRPSGLITMERKTMKYQIATRAEIFREGDLY